MDYKDYIKKHKIDINSYDPEFSVALLFTEALLSKGWTQKKLAQKMGKHQESISMWESGARIPSLKTLVLLAKVIGKELVIKFK